MPFFEPGDDPGSNFPELLRRVGLSGRGEQSGQIDVPHATTCVALTYADGVVMAGDRRATSGNLISHRSMEKVVQADSFSGVAIAGAAGPAMEMTSAAPIAGIRSSQLVIDRRQLSGSSGNRSNGDNANRCRCLNDRLRTNCLAVCRP